ncbi:hypothetical protein M427DRAFT_502500, partial [Gonapodya prolifera JEL478]
QGCAVPRGAGHQSEKKADCNRGRCQSRLQATERNQPCESPNDSVRSRAQYPADWRGKLFFCGRFGEVSQRERGSRQFANICDISGLRGSCAYKVPRCFRSHSVPKGTVASVLHDIDATQLRKAKALKDSKFDCIGFLFPQVGGLDHQERNIIANQYMLRGVFTSCSSLLSQNGQILVVLKDKEPYLSWNIKKIAKVAGLQCLRSWALQPSWYPGYTHRRTLGF